MSTELNLTTQPLDSGFLVEASAGTGKTYSVAALVTRLVATHEDVRIGNILITTFTRNAAAELRDRIRRRLVDTANALSSPAPSDRTEDEIIAFLRKGTESEVRECTARLRRAAVEFDTATIATIHSVLSKILTLAGHSMTPGDDESASARIIDEVVNDALLNQAAGDEPWDESRIAALVKARLAEPLTELWFDPAEHDDATVLRLKAAVTIVEAAAAEVVRRSREHPSFSDLMREAHAVVTDPRNAALVAEFRQRYVLAMVDESQDTDAIQWDLFNTLFPAGGSGVLVAVGDPKQSIYKFRGADVDAYSAQKSTMPVVTLETNYRTDQPLIDSLNVLFDGFTFGPTVQYARVTASPDHAASGIAGVPPFETVNFGDTNNGRALARATARRVLHLLDTARIERRAVLPGEIVVLVRSGANGRLIERELRKWGVPAVSAGTASVMDSEMAGHIRLLLESMERVSDVGRARRVAGTRFVDSSLLDPRLLDDDFVTGIQDSVASMATVLRAAGVAGLMASMLNDHVMVARITAGVTGQRNLTDFSHVMEVLHDHSQGSGHSPEALLQVFDELAATDSTSELVARRVESDLNAVQIMTIHVSKGLEFPVVVVADTWTKPTEKSTSPKVVRLEHDGKSRRIIDVTHALRSVSSASAKSANEEAEMEEMRRLFYVALTRAKHHVSLMLAPFATKRAPVAVGTANGDALTAVKSLPMVNAADLPAPTVFGGAAAAGVDVALEVNGVGGAVRQTYRRTSFTGITAAREGAMVNPGAAAGAGADEMTNAHFGGVQYAPAGIPTGADMPLARVPGGTLLGKVMHSVYELLDFAATDLPAEVERVVQSTVTGSSLRPYRTAIARAVVASLTTPLSGGLTGRTLSSFATADRLAEMDFEMGLPAMAAGVTVRDVGRVLVSRLADDDVLMPYAQVLAGRTFDIPLAGLLNGSIDALLRTGSGDDTRLYVTDYKTNRLDTEDDTALIDAYEPSRLVSAMEHHHYPLQALIYGTAVHRWLRWRAPHLNPDATVAGISYFFVRGMCGPSTLVDAAGDTYGVFTWTPPAGLWSALSGAMNGGTK